MGSKIDVVSQHIEGSAFLFFFLYVLKDESGFSYTFLAENTEYSYIPIDGPVLLPEKIHRSKLQELIKLFVE